jgi:hypothetical protein
MQNAVSTSAIGSATIITMVYYCIPGEKREPEEDECWGGTVIAKASIRKERSATEASDPKGEERQVEGVEWKRLDQFFISKHAGASIS